MAVKKVKKIYRKKKNTNIPCPNPWAWLLTGILIGILPSIIAYFYESDKKLEVVVSEKVESKKPLSADNSENSTDSNEKTTPNFKFYDALPNEEKLKIQGKTKDLLTEHPSAFLPAEEEIETENVTKEHPSAFLPAEIVIKPPKIESDETDKQIMLQVASYLEEENAQNLLNKLEELNMSTEINQMDINGNTWYRVQVGSFSNLDLANQAIYKLKQYGLNAILLK
jgi:cell division protein FtsN